MTVPSGMYRTCRTGRLLNVVIFTMGPSLREKEKGRGGARRRRPCHQNVDPTAVQDAFRRLPPPLRSPAFSQCLLHHWGT
jgi:hypothetical protein